MPRWKTVLNVLAWGHSGGQKGRAWRGAAGMTAAGGDISAGSFVGAVVCAVSWTAWRLATGRSY